MTRCEAIVTDDSSESRLSQSSSTLCTVGSSTELNHSITITQQSLLIVTTLHNGTKYLKAPSSPSAWQRHFRFVSHSSLPCIDRVIIPTRPTIHPTGANLLNARVASSLRARPTSSGRAACDCQGVQLARRSTSHSKSSTSAICTALPHNCLQLHTYIHK